MKKSAIWVFAFVGGMSVCLSLFLCFTTTVFAACEAEVVCADGMPKMCSCAGSGACSSSVRCVECVCANTGHQKECCKESEID